MHAQNNRGVCWARVHAFQPPPGFDDRPVLRSPHPLLQPGAPGSKDGLEPTADPDPIEPEKNAGHAAWLKQIQGNILKPHGRAFTRLVLFKFDGEGVDPSLRQLLAAAVQATDIAGKLWGVTSAYQQWLDANNRTRDPNRPFYGFGVSLTGLMRCGYEHRPDLPLRDVGDALRGFGLPMNQAFEQLGDASDADGAPRDWEEVYRENVDGVWVLAHAALGELDAMERCVTDLLTAHRASKVAVENGQTWRDAAGNPREPFGFRDCISEPMFFKRDCLHNAAGESLVPRWTNIPRHQVLIDAQERDGRPSRHNGGSFLVLRKLEQNVKAFRELEASIDLNQLSASMVAVLPREAGALLIGRERDGTPLAEAADPANPKGPNRFDFHDDAARCPFHAHIRKAAPRTTVEDLKPTAIPHGDVNRARAALFVRRSVVYDDRTQLPPGGAVTDANAATYSSRSGREIERDVGLLFMGYMSNIREQFVRMQMSWFGEVDFPFERTGLGDPLISPHATREGADIPAWQWQSLPKISLAQTVTPKGGAYFYVPSIAWLKNQSPTSAESAQAGTIETAVPSSTPR